METAKRIEGFFLAFTPQESEMVLKRLEALGYDPDVGGLRELVIDALEGEEEKKETSGLVDKLNGFIHENPEVVTAGAAVLRKLLFRRK